MRIIGLTGGIASGKSTVASMFAQAGVTVLDADALYHSLLVPHRGEPSLLAQAIEAQFPGVLNSDGSVNRTRLATLVFGNTIALERLGSITHPAVSEQFTQAIARLREQGVELVVYDVPLLYEKGLEAKFHEAVVVWVPKEIQVERLIARDALSAEEINARLNSQIPLNEKRKRATWLIDNSGTISATQQQVTELILKFSLF